MLTLFKLVRNLFKQLKSDLTPRQLAVGVFFGALLGLTPAGLHWLVLFTLALFFNCSMAACLLLWGALKPLGWALGGASFSLGGSLLRGGGVHASLADAASNAPILAYMGYERYVVAGAYAIAVPVALALALLVRFGVASYRAKYMAKMEDAAWYQKVTAKWFSRIFVNLLFGKKVELEEKKPRFILLRPFRPYMLPVIPVFYVALTVGGGLWAQIAIQGIAAEGLSRAMGVKVTFGKIEYSFFGQRLAFENLQVPDPAKPTQDMVRVGGFEADLGFLSLLSKRLHIERLSVRDVSANVERADDGTLNVSKVPAAKPAPDAPAGEQAAWEEWMKWLAEKGKDADWNGIWQKYQAYRTKRAEERAKAETDLAAAKPVLTYDPDLRWEPARRDPFFRVDLVEAKNLALAAGGAGKLPALTSVDVSGAELSTKPGWNGRAMTLKGAGKLDGGRSGSISFSFTVLPPKTEGGIRLDGAPLVDYRALYESSLPVRTEAGAVSVALKGGTLDRAIDAGINLRIDGLKVAAKPGETRILGLDPQMSAYAIQGINAYGEKLPVVVGAGLGGTLDAPEVSAKLPFLEIAKKGLEMLGRKELDQAIARLGGEVDSLKQLGAGKLAPLEGDFMEVQNQTLKAIQTGDTKGLQEAIRKGQADVKSLPDAKKDLEQKKDDAKKTIEGVKDLFKKK